MLFPERIFIIIDKNRKGNFNFVLLLFGVGLFGLVFCFARGESAGSSKPALSPTSSSDSSLPGSPRFSYETELSDSGSEPDVHALLKDVLKQQADLRSEVSQLRLGRTSLHSPAPSASSGSWVPVSTTSAWSSGSPAKEFSSLESGSSGGSRGGHVERAAGADDPELLTGVDRLLTQLKEHERVVASDSATGGSSPMITLLGPNEKVARVVTLVQKTSEDSRSAMLEHLTKYNDISDWTLDSKGRKNED